jgi:hypothetical protein
MKFQHAPLHILSGSVYQHTKQNNVPMFVSGHPCSRYQFECHSSGECIAIYNACDGIAQCADGSDEALELDCPNLGN